MKIIHIIEAARKEREKASLYMRGMHLENLTVL